MATQLMSVRPLGERRTDMRHAFVIREVFEYRLLALVAEIIEVTMNRVMTVAARTFRVCFSIEPPSVVCFLREIFEFAHAVSRQRYRFKQFISGLVCCHTWCLSVY